MSRIALCLCQWLNSGCANHAGYCRYSPITSGKGPAPHHLTAAMIMRQAQTLNCSRLSRSAIRCRAAVNRPFTTKLQAIGANGPDAAAVASRRQALMAAWVLGGFGNLLALSPVARAEDAVEEVPLLTPAASTSGKFEVLSDPILAYEFKYPVQSISGKDLRMVLAHVPEKYSSAAPLTADARQRIVSELLDLRSFITVSMTVGPASGVLKDVPEAEWRPQDVALTVLIDRSTSRVSNGQRIALNDVEESHKEEKDGRAYFMYEHLSQGSPNITEKTKETYRHALAVTSARLGVDGTPYLYTLNMSCREQMWDDLKPLFKQSIESFTLLPTTGDYISPDTNPWLFF